MNTELIHEIMEALPPKLFDNDDLRSLYFYEGAFYVFSDQEIANNLNSDLLHSYLSNFLDEEWVVREMLETNNPQLLSRLDELLVKTAKQGV